MSNRSSERPAGEKPESVQPPGESQPNRESSDSDNNENSRHPVGGVIFLVMIALLLAMGWQWLKSPSNFGVTVSYDFLWNQLAKQNVTWVKFHGEVLTGQWKEVPVAPEPKDAKEAKRTLTKDFNVNLPLADDKKLLEQLLQEGVEVKSSLQSPGVAANIAMWVLGFGPMIFLAWMLWSTLRRSSDPMGSGMFGSFIRSPAQRFRPSDQQTTFADVAAMEGAKQELMEIVDFLKNPAKYQRLGAHIPKGVLLVGPPGTGKTLLARATAGEAGVPFYSINGSEFIQMFVGVGASRVRDLFRNAKENSPCLVFIDEIDAVGRVRGAGLGGGHDEREQTLNQILSEMDGFEQTEAVIVIAATNRPDVLDAALLRPGRFDRHVTVDRPTRQGREEILRVHSRKVPLADDVSLAEVAAGTIGFSGAELKNLVNEAALSSARTGRDTVTADDFDYARDKILMGPMRKEVLSPREREITAYHEAGHALLAWYLPEMDPVHKVTIIPRGRALGVTQLLPDEERYNVGEQRLHSMLAFALGGRAAEKLVYNEYSAGAEDDLKRSTQTARRMVSRWGMSEAVGPVAFHTGEEQPFLGKEMSHEHREFSEETARLIDREIQRLMQEAARVAHDMLVKYRDQLDSLTRLLLAKESIDRDDMVGCLGPLPPRSDSVTVLAPIP